MVTYIYFVKCPNCEDEHFDFFDDAKAFALGCLSQKPVITQTEVCRNDFGECTDHSDLGTIWSWEEAMKDTESSETDAEPTKSIFTKDDLKRMADGQDPEFDDDDFFFNNSLVEDAARRISFKNTADYDEFIKLCKEIGIFTGADLNRFMNDAEADDGNLLDKLRAYRDELGDDFKVEECTERKPIPEGMTIEQLVEEMEENEDTVECTWCNDLFDKSECRKEVDLGWLCSRCEAAIKSRGETLTFKENNYWDFLDEKLDLDLDFTNCVDSSDMEIWGLKHVREDIYKAILLKRFENVDQRGFDESQKVTDKMYAIDGAFTFYFLKDGSPDLSSWNVNLLRKLGSIRIDFEDNRYETAVAKVFNRKAIKEEITSEYSIEDLVKDSINHLVNDLGKDSTAEDFVDDVILDVERNYDNFVPELPENHRKWASAIACEVSRQLNNQLIEEAKTKTWICQFDGREIGTVEASTEEEAYEAMEREYPEYHYGLYDGVGIVYPADEDELDENVKEIHDLGNEYDGGYPTETPEVSDSHLKLCPECGKEAFDIETGICVECGFN